MESFKLELPGGVKDVNLLLQALGELPGKISYHMLKSIEEQWKAYSAENGDGPPA